MHRRVDDEIALVDYYPAYDTALAWYQDPQLCRQVDNLDGVYSLEKLKAMYTYLTTHGECYYIKYNGKLVGDTVCLVVCREYQNRHIGRRCVQALAELAAEKGRTRLRAHLPLQQTEPGDVPRRRVHLRRGRLVSPAPPGSGEGAKQLNRSAKYAIIGLRISRKGRSAPFFHNFLQHPVRAPADGRK